MAFDRFFARVSVIAICFPLTWINAACKAKPQASTVAYIVGPTNDIIPVNSDSSERVPLNVFRSTGLIVTRLQGDKVKYCSGALAAPESPGENFRVITNHHCFATTDDRGMSSELLLVEACTGTDFYLGFAPSLGTPPERAGCKAGSLRTNPTMDLAVFTLSRALPTQFAPLPIWDGDSIPAERPALIIHYPDTDMNQAIPPGQKTRLPTASFTTTDCRTGGSFPAEEWDLDRSLPYGLRHTCDLIHGSSGSPLIDAETQKIIGVNWGGIKIKYGQEEKVYNVATRAVFLRQFLNGTAGSNNQAGGDLDALAAQKAAATSGQKKSKLPTNCGVAGVAINSTAPLNAILLFITVFVAPLISLGFGFIYAPKAVAEEFVVPPPPPPPPPPPHPMATGTTTDQDILNEDLRTPRQKKYEYCLDRLADMASADDQFMQVCLGDQKFAEPTTKAQTNPTNKLSKAERERPSTVYPVPGFSVKTIQSQTKPLVEITAQCHDNLVKRLSKRRITPTGDIALTVFVRDQGTVVDVAMEDSEIVDETFLACLEENIKKKWKLVASPSSPKGRNELNAVALDLAVDPGHPKAKISVVGPRQVRLGGLTNREIREALRSFAPQLQSCPAASTEQSSREPKAIEIDFTINNKGAVQTLQLSSPALVTEKKLESCLRGRIQAWQFPKPRLGQRTLVSQVLSLVPAALSAPKSAPASLPASLPASAPSPASSPGPAKK